jgi:hypothetical protein
MSLSISKCESEPNLGENAGSLLNANQHSELAEALGVAVTMNAGAALVYSSRAPDAFDASMGA